MSPAQERRFGIYVHVPFCAVRCGYCDFNTYAPGDDGFSSRDGYVDAAIGELGQARRALAGDPRAAATVFFGGGTPTMLDAAALARMLSEVRDLWGVADDAEVTTEANPDSVSRASLVALADAGFTRVSFGMQSAVPHVLATLERTHRPDNVARAVEWAREAGLKTSVDLIYGTPGETLADWGTSVDAAIALDPDHVSAYALVIEPGTRMGMQQRRGDIEAVDPDLQADMYELADERLAAAGYNWYEVSNWAREESGQCRHNIGYWRGDDWWGIGPGAHSYLGPRTGPDGDEVAARRWWNVKLPRAYAARVAAGESPEQDGESLTEDDVALERVMLGIRLAHGLPRDAVSHDRADAIAQLIADDVLDGASALRGTLRLTRRGRLLADAVVRALT